MKLVISYEELYSQPDNANMQDITYWDLTERFIQSQFPEWDINEAFIANTFQTDPDNKEVSIELRYL